jgi:DNA-binding NtrC family response regulator
MLFWRISWYGIEQSVRYGSAAQASKIMQPCKVLLVDDEPMVAKALKRVLRKESYEVVCAGSAAEALEILSGQSFDVVVSDEMMPGMPGSDLLGVIYERYPETIRIMLTGHPNLDTALRSINTGHVYRFLIKPCSGMELSITIKQAIQHRELLRKSLSLLETVRRQSSFLEKLEKRHPGITKVNREIDGTIDLSDIQEDLEALLKEIDAEVERSECFFKNSDETGKES